MLAMAKFRVKAFNIEVSNNQYNLISLVTLLARTLILLNWKQRNPPTHLALVRDVMGHLKLEKNVIFTEREYKQVLFNFVTFHRLFQ